MTLSVTIERGAPRTGGGRLCRGLRRIREAASEYAALAVRPHRASLKRLGEIPLTFAGLGCGDYAAFHLHGGWGWVATMISLVVLEHMIADPD